MASLFYVAKPLAIGGREQEGRQMGAHRGRSR